VFWQLAFFMHNDTPGNGQVAVIPCVPETAAVAGHAQLQIATLGKLRNRLQFRTRGVRVSAHDCEPRARGNRAAHGKRDQRGHVAGEKILATWVQLPAVGGATAQSVLEEEEEEEEEGQQQQQ
jgi:hypothetical protein